MNIESEVARLEGELVKGAGIEADVAALLDRIGASADDALLCRAYGLLSRAQSAQGRHEPALRTAETGLRIIARLDESQRRRSPVVHSEMLRTAGGALCTLGRITEGLPLLEDAVGIAQAGIDAPGRSHMAAAPFSPELALVRSLATLGSALFAVGDLEATIDVNYRAIQTADVLAVDDERSLIDVMLLRANLTDALHERIRRRRAAGDLAAAERDTIAAGSVIDAATRQIDRANAVLGPYGRAAYFAAFGNHQLITANPVAALAAFERELAEIELVGNMQHWAISNAQANIARALLDLQAPQAALEHTDLALAALDRHDDPSTRATVLLVRACAYHAIGHNDAAYVALEDHHRLRASLEAVSAQHYASHMTAKLGLERARTDAEAHRRVAATLEMLGEIGQQITATLDTGLIFALLSRNTGSLLRAATFAVWLLNAEGDALTLAYGIEDERPFSLPDIALDAPDSDAARAIRERRAIVCTAASNRLTVRPLLGTRIMQASLFEPLLAGDRIIGVASIGSDSADSYSEDERLIFRTLSTHAAIALDNAAAYTKLEETVLALQSAQAELARQTARFEHLSLTDALTGVANRRHLSERAQTEIAATRREADHLALLLFDIDHFKAVNDTYGHAVGDAVIQEVAQAAKDRLRPRDLLSRIGGEEFVLLLPGATMSEAAAIAERIRSRIAEGVVVHGDRTINVTCSFGVATCDADSDTLERVLSRADAALYAAKHGGRNRVQVA